MNFIKRSLLGLIVFAILQSQAFAHSYARYVSTPISPPKEFDGWQLISIGILLAGSFLCYWQVIRRRWWVSIILSILATSAFYYVFFMYGRYISRMSTDPPTGLGEPCSTFWGFGWEHEGSSFIKWNILGFIFFTISILLISRIFRRRKSSNESESGNSDSKKPLKIIATMLICLLAYTIGLVPFIKHEALVHGWCGGYVSNGCSDNLTTIYIALYNYAHEHDDRLPEAEDFHQLLEKIEPYIDKERIRFDYFPIGVCTIGGAYERNPKYYIWNKSFNGMSLDELRTLDPDEIFRNDLDTPIECPYQERSGIRALYGLFEYIEEQEKEDTNDNGLIDALAIEDVFYQVRAIVHPRQRLFL